MTIISNLGLALSRGFRRTAPEPFVLAILLTLVAALLALSLGDFPGKDTETSSAEALLDAWRSGDGLWKFLAFGMQMCLVLVTGHALASSRPVAAGIRRLAALPTGAPAAAVLVALVAMLAALVNWGLGLIVGALLARDVGRALKARGVRVHAPLLAAAGYSAMVVWHGGLSGSAPLTMTTVEGAAKVLPAPSIAAMQAGGGEAMLGLDQTLFSPLNLVATGGALVLVALMFWMLTPRGVTDSIVEPADAEDTDAAPASEERGFPAWLDRSPWLAWLIGLAFIGGVVRYAGVSGLGRVGLNEINGAMLGIGLLAHGSTRSYVRAVEDGARACSGVILQFPLYAGIMGMLAASGLISKFAGWSASVGGESLTPIMTYLSAGVVNLFVPSGGGQWGIQGPIALEAGAAAGVSPAKMVLAVAYGDQLTNMLQPFWALPLLAITGQKARDIVGYTAVVMVAAGLWFGACLLLF